ncbi:MAG TPA: class I SAM-dependent methyltransferase [Casimicrobiaceae bacterium]|nr:class I SAM-dependent methyltransferase [Casimicrobiaceae bacterium]
MARPTIHNRPIPWVSETLIDFDGVQLELCVPEEIWNVACQDELAQLYERQSTENHFILGKSRTMVEELMQSTEALDVRTMIDVGVYKGGSVVFFNEVFRPEKLVAIERNSAAIPALASYCNDPVRIDRVRVFLGVDQADRPALGRICRHEFADQPLDLIVDDASHFFDETRSTFRALFPRLRPGGIYIIEDWGWAHWRGDHWQKERGGDYFRGKLPLSNLLVELMLLCAGSPELVRSVTFNSTVIYVERGDGAVEPGFEPSDHWFNRGDPVPRVGAAAAPSTVYSSPTFVIRG